MTLGLSRKLLQISDLSGPLSVPAHPRDFFMTYGAKHRLRKLNSTDVTHALNLAPENQNPDPKKEALKREIILLLKLPDEFTQESSLLLLENKSPWLYFENKRKNESRGIRYLCLNDVENSHLALDDLKNFLASISDPTYYAIALNSSKCGNVYVIVLDKARYLCCCCRIFCAHQSKDGQNAEMDLLTFRDALKGALNLAP